MKLALALGLVLVPSIALAQPAGAQAEILFRQAKGLMAQKKYAEACAMFEASQKLDPAVTTLLNDADCREKNGQLATAWGLFLDAERQTRGDAKQASLNTVAKGHAAKLEPRLSTLQITVEGAAKLDGLAITRNGEAVDAITWNRAMPTDGGAVKIVAHVAGAKDWSTSITIANEGEHPVVTIPNLREVAKAPVVAVVTPKPEPKPEPKPVPKPEPVIVTKRENSLQHQPTLRGSHRSKVVPIALASAGGALVIGAVGFEVWGRGTYSDAENEPNDAKQASLWTKANHERYVAEGLAIGGLACAGVAIFMFVRHGATEPATEGVSLAPIVTGDAGGLVVGGHF